MPLADLGLMQLVPALRPDWREPWHLRKWVELIERALLGGMRGMVSIPFQHWKSTTTLVGVVWLLLRNPKLKIILLTHSHEKAAAMGKDLRELWKAAGGTTRKGFDTIAEWQTEAGGGCVIMSAAQSKLGYPCDLLLVDDPLDEKEYLLKETRDLVDGKIALYTARAASHLNSVLIVASRWHPDDPIGRRLASKAVRWEYVCSAGVEGYDDALVTTMSERGAAPAEIAAALASSGARAFAPDVLSLEAHVQMRAEWAERESGLRTWWAQVQNEPRPDVLGLFGNPMRYDAEPAYGRWVIGVDLAYSKEASADYFAMVVLKVWDGRAHVVNVLREHRDLDMATQRIRFALRQYPGAPVFSYVSGPELGAITYLNDRGIPAQPMHARYDKGTRARHTIDAWNEGRILVPAVAPWAQGFVSRCALFTGHPQATDDDEIDALVSAYDGGVLGGGSAPRSFGSARVTR